MIKTITVATILSALAFPALAEEVHHPEGAASETSAVSAPAPASASATGPGMMNQGQMRPGMMGPGMGQGMTGQGMMSGGMMNCPMMGMMGAGDSHIEGRLAYLKAELKITSRQDHAWNAYADAVRGIHKDMMGMMGSAGPGMMQQGSQVSAPDAMKTRITMMEGHVKALKSFHSATTKLYGALSDEQKQMADQLLGRGMGIM